MSAPPWRGLAAAGLVLAASAVAAHQARTAPDDGVGACPGHWHSAFLVFMDGHRVHFDRPVFFQTPGGIHDYHMHADDQVMHYHPPFRDGCIPFSRFLLRLGITLDGSSIAFNENFGANEGTYPVGAGHQLALRYAPFGEAWREAGWGDLAGRQLRPGEKVLISYGNLTEDLLQQQEAQVRDLGPDYLPPSYADRAREILDARTVPPG
jgi:hypothetical protein